MNPLIKQVAITCVAAFVLTAGVAQAQTSKTTSELKGSWKFDRESLDGKKVKCEIRLKEVDGKLVGEYSDSEKFKQKIGSAVIKGEQVEIKIAPSDKWTAKTVFKGKINGDKISGTANYYSSDADKWNATRFISLEEAVGTWQMVFTTPDGTERKPEFVLSIKDGKPQIEMEPGEGDDDSGEPKIKNVKYKQGLLVFDVTLDFQQQELGLEYELEFLTTDTIEGSMFFELKGIGQEGEVDLEGERVK
ncbi:MAG: hypothetical protein P8J33_03415 [Pirellulaceae bacterium]|nr:hypothetical protein [Pirellulaceae bacterium]